MTESNSERYVIACIRIPMKLFENGKYDLINKLANIEFEECNKLPEKGNLEECNLNSIFDKFYINSDILSNTENDEPEMQNNCINDKQEEPIPKMYVLKSEIQKKPKHSKNNTFKCIIKNTLNRFSRKNRE